MRHRFAAAAGIVVLATGIQLALGAASTVPAGYRRVVDEATPLPPRAEMRFSGASVSASDNDAGYTLVAIGGMAEVDSVSDTAIPSSSAWTDVQGLLWSVVAGQRTGFDCILIFECANTEARYAFAVYAANDGKDDITHHAIEYQTQDNDYTGTDNFSSINLTAYQTMPLTAACTAANAELSARIWGRILVGTTDENIRVQAQASGFGITLKKGSFCEYYIK